MNTLFLNHRSLLSLTAGVALFLYQSSFAKPLKAGEPFPDLTACQLEGELPAELRGKIVLVDFWASWCGPCKGSFPVLEALHKKYADKGVVVLGVNLDESNQAMKEFLAKHPISFPVVRDASQKLVKQLSIPTMPSSFVLDREGKVRFVHHGFHGASTQKEYAREIEELLNAK